MKNWQALARANGLEVSDEELQRITAPLEALEAAFRPLVSSLTPDAEPIAVICQEEDAQ